MKTSVELIKRLQQVSREYKRLYGKASPVSVIRRKELIDECLQIVKRLKANGDAELYAEKIERYII